MKKDKKYKLMTLSVLGLAAGFLRLQTGRTNLHFKPRPKAGDIRVACVGDSITYGSMCGNWLFRNYPFMLGKLLGKGYCVGNFAVSGTTIQDTGDYPYSSQIYFRESIEYQPDIVIIAFGSNDSKKLNWKGREAFKEQYREFLRYYSELPSQPRILLATPAAPHIVRGREWYGIRRKQCGIISEVVRELAEELAMELVDLFEHTADHPEWFYVDGVHPQSIGAREIAGQVYESMQAGGNR